MSFDISNELKNTFELATLKRQAMHGLSAKDWDAFQKITDNYDAKRRFEARAYKLEYKTRVDEVTRKLIDKAGSKTKDFKHRIFGSDAFDKDALRRKAHLQVRGEYENTLSALQQSELLEKRDLMARAKPAHNLKHSAKHQFARATDRREGLDRRRSRSIGPARI
jgi:hypothetical protein